MKNILHGYSGGAFYLEAMANGAYIAHQHLPPNLYIGSSSGALLAVVAAIKGAEEMLELARSIDPKKAFNYIPFKKNGKFKKLSYLRLICGKSPAAQDARPILRKIIPKQTYLNYLSSNRPPAFVLVGELEIGERMLFNIKEDCSNYSHFIDTWEASTRMQGMTEPIEIDGLLAWDGGQFDHNPAHLLIEDGISDVVCVWSRPKNWRAKYQSLKNAHYIMKLLRMIELDNIEKSNNDEERIDGLCEDIGIKPIHIYTERTLINPYDTDRDRLNLAIQSTIKSAQKAFKSKK